MSAVAVRPKLPPKPGQTKAYLALADHQSTHPKGLSFVEGDIIYATETDDKEWQKAVCHGKTGLVPTSFINENAENVPNPMHEAAKRGNLDLLEECVKNKLPVNSLDSTKNTPLHWNNLGDTPLHNAAYKGRSEVVQLLVEKGARNDILNRDYKAPFDLSRDPKCKVWLQYNVNTEELKRRDSEYFAEDGNEESD